MAQSNGHTRRAPADAARHARPAHFPSARQASDAPFLHQSVVGD